MSRVRQRLRRGGYLLPSAFTVGHMQLRFLGRIGWIIPVFFVVCAATRLARFNVQTKVVDSRYFVGLPVPAAASTLCAYLLFQPYPPVSPYPAMAMSAALLVLGVLMVSTFRYPSFKKVDLR